MGIIDIVSSFGGHQNEPNLGTILNSFGGHQGSGGTTPAPSFSVAPSISPSSGAVGATFTGSDGTINNGTVSARQWLLNGSAISGATGASYVSAAAGTLTYRVTATGAGGTASATSAGVTVAAAPSLSGFYMNGSTNPQLKSSFANVPTTSSRWVIKGDSTSAGIGGGTPVTTSGGTQQNLGGARTKRATAVLADLYQSAGIPLYDRTLFADNGTGGGGRYTSTGCDLPTYDPRVANITRAGSTSSHIWQQESLANFPGGALLHANLGVATLTAASCDRFEVTVYTDNAGDVVGCIIDGNPTPEGNYTTPATHSVNNGAWFASFTRSVSGVGTHTLGMNGPDSGNVLVRSIRPFRSDQPAIDIINQSTGGATTVDQAMDQSGDGGGQLWHDLESLGYDLPAFTIINLGINDMNGGTALNTSMAALQKIITKAKATGDVLLMTPHPFGSASDALQTAFSDAAKQLAVSNGIAFFSLREYYGPFTPAINARTQGDGVHPLASWYSEIAGLMKQAIDLMRA